jgi:hypothetical protein
MLERQNLTAIGYSAVALLGGTAIAIAPLLALGHAEPHSNLSATRILAGTIASLLAIAWAIYFARRAYGTGDEFQREKEKSAWYWGGSVGLAASVPLLFFIGVGGLHWIDPVVPTGLDLMRAFLLGYFLPVVLMTCGYLASRFWPRAFHR